MSAYDIIRRKVERASHCRGCDKGMVKGDDIIYTYSGRNRGQNILFCIDCAKLIGKLAEGCDDDKDKFKDQRFCRKYIDDLKFIRDISEEVELEIMVAFYVACAYKESEYPDSTGGSEL